MCADHVILVQPIFGTMQLQISLLLVAFLQLKCMDWEILLSVCE